MATPTAEHQRARGALRLGLGLRDGQTVLRDLYQSGCLKARLPRRENGAHTGAILLNTAGGIAGGDTLSLAVRLGAGAAATITTQAAERIYRALPDSAPSRIETRLSVAEGAALEWLPQETILFNAANLARRVEIDLAVGALFLGVEMLVFGRAASGEVLRAGAVRDRVTVRREGRLVWQDTLLLSGDIAGKLARPAIGGGAASSALLLFVAPQAEAFLDPLREAWAGMNAECGASAWDGMLIGRVLAANGALLRAAIVAGLASLRGARPLPRIWLT